jgi:1-deoxy-D-xylulose-5-phosphate synthase
MAPADEPELRAALELALRLETPSAIRYPRDQVPPPLSEAAPEFELGKCRPIRDGEHATLLAYGTEVEFAQAAADILAEEGIRVAVVNARFCKPIDAEMVTTAVTRGTPVLTIEDHSVAGGFGSAVLETANRLGLPTEHIVRLGLGENTFYKHGSRAGQLAEAGIDAAGIAAAVRRAVGARLGDAAPREASRPAAEVAGTRSPTAVAESAARSASVRDPRRP